jgi:hypothetical protein
MNAADQVVTFGSSVGIEAVFWGKPSILLGPCFYQDLGGTYQPKSLDEAVELISKRQMPLDPIGAYMYGLWMQTHGIRFEYFKPEGLFHGRFKGQVVYNKPPRKTLLFKLGRLLSGTRRDGKHHRQLAPQEIRN